MSATQAKIYFIYKVWNDVLWEILPVIALPCDTEVQQVKRQQQLADMSLFCSTLQRVHLSICSVNHTPISCERRQIVVSPLALWEKIYTFRHTELLAQERKNTCLNVLIVHDTSWKKDVEERTADKPYSTQTRT